MARSADPKQVIEGEVLDLQKQETELSQLQETLSQNEQFSRFMQLSKAVSSKREEVRKHIEAVMVPAYHNGQIDKSVKGEWGSATVIERDDFDITESLLPAKFFKRVPDTTKIRKTFQLEGKAPRGCTAIKKYGIMLKIKGVE